MIFFEALQTTSHGVAHSFLRNMLKNGIIARQELALKKYSYTVLADSKTVTPPRVKTQKRTGIFVVCGQGVGTGTACYAL